MKTINQSELCVQISSPYNYEQLIVEVETGPDEKGYTHPFFLLNQDGGPEDIYIEFHNSKEPWKIRLSEFKSVLACAESRLLKPNEFV